MLAWGIAAALPIVIHLWSRRRYSEQPWAAMQFLIVAIRNSARRIQLEQWILLAVRVSILGLFAMAIAQPRWRAVSGFMAGGAEGRTHLVLVIDGSYSMDYRHGDKSRFELAKEMAKQLVAGRQQGDGYSLVLMTHTPRVVVGEPALNRDDLLREIDDLALLHGGANLPAALTEVETLLNKADERPGRGARWTERRVVIFSDLQRATWKEASSSDCSKCAARIAKLASIEVVDVGQGAEENVALARLDIESPLGGAVTIGSTIQIRAELQSFAREDRHRLPVEVLIDGVRVDDQRTDLPASGRATIAIAHRFDAPGEHVIEAHLADDALPIDNHRWLVVPVREAVHVLCVGGVPSDTRLVALALAPQKQNSQAIEVVEALESRLLESDLGRFDCVVLSNIGRFSREEAALLHRFVSRGGGLIFFLGSRVHADTYNQVFCDDPNSRLLPARIEEPAATGSYQFDPLEYRHAIVAPFRSFEHAGLLNTPIWKYMRIKPSERSKTALALDTGDPAIVEGQVGRGRCTVVALPASSGPVEDTAASPTPWTALAVWPSFPPLVQEMLRQAIAGRGEGRNLLVGDELTGRMPTDAVQQTVALSGPGGINDKLTVRAEATEHFWQFGPANFAGIYSAQIGGGSRRYAVNVVSSEGDLARIDPESLPAEYRHEAVEPTRQIEAAANNDTAFFRYLLSAVLLLLVVEPSLACHFGRRRR